MAISAKSITYGSILEPRCTIKNLVTGDHTGFLRRLHKETSQRGQRLIACTTPDGQWGWGGSGGQQLWDCYNDSGSMPVIAPNCSIELQWR
ncbi:TPA: hypothetical protein EYN09_04475, partial [Candidatus Poribacteria bacterium]|nr:hypothetical protein [Candidatus Poribacteria bacterium]